MKNFLLLFAAALLHVAAGAQVCSGSLAWSQVSNTYTVNFTNTSTATGGAAGASNSQFISIYGGATPSPGTLIASYSGTSASHTFPTGGAYTAVARVIRYDSTVVPAVQLCQDTTWYPLNLAYQPCAVSITSTSGAGGTRTFTANYNIGYPGVTFTWDFGDGSPTVTGTQATHIYTATGPYTVTVTAAGPGCTNTASTTVNINSVTLNCANTTAGFTVNAATTNAVFTNTSMPAAGSVSGMVRYNYWTFGQSGSATTTGQQGVTFPYGIPGTYNVRLVTHWVAAGTMSPVLCADTFDQTVVVANGIFNCATASASFTTTVYNGNQVFVSSTSTSVGGYDAYHEWDWGNSLSYPPMQQLGFSHNYANSGTYTIRMIERWYPSNSTTLLCTDTAYSTVTVTAPNFISGHVAVDSNLVQNSDSFKVWLISYDPATTLLQAVDSLVTPGWGASGFSFNNKPAGIYRTKAHKLYQAPGTLGFVPTYRDSSLTWNGAQTFTHTGGVTYSGSIYLKQGLVTAGPGFISGSVLSGANKGTADGDPVANQLVFLRNAATGALVQGVYTNAAGVYSFSNVPLGSYTVYPEEMNYATTPSSIITLAAGTASVSSILFKKDDVDMDIKPASSTGMKTIAENALGFAFVPNPTSGRVSLAIEDAAAGEADVRVTSMTGQVVYTGRMATARAALLDLSHLQSGVYFVTVSAQTGVSSAKLVIAR